MKLFILLALLVAWSAVAEAQTQWRLGTSCTGRIAGEPAAPYTAILGTTDRQLVFCPAASTTAAAPLYVESDGVCVWDDANSGEDLLIIYTINGDIRWHALGGVGCDPSVTGECSAFDVYGGEDLTISQVGTTAATRLVCRIKALK